VRHRSKKRQRLYDEERIPIVKEMLEENPVCVRCWREPSTDVHERLSRARGGSITDKANLVCLCRVCHDWITQHPREAEETGWSLKTSHTEPE